MMQQLKQLASKGVLYALVRIEETKYWRDDISQKAGKIEGIYLIDLTKPTNLCSFEINYPAELTRNYIHNFEAFSEDELTEFELMEGGDGYPYFLETDSFEIAKEYMEGEYDEVLEYESGNPTVC